LDAIIGPNGKTEKLEKVTKRAEKAELQLQEAVQEATQTSCDAVRQAVVLLSSKRPDFDVDESMKKAQEKLSRPPRRPNGTVAPCSEDEGESTPEAA
jgi:hypothetical protein